MPGSGRLVELTVMMVFFEQACGAQRDVPGGADAPGAVEPEIFKELAHVANDRFDRVPDSLIGLHAIFSRAGWRLRKGQGSTSAGWLSQMP